MSKTHRFLYILVLIKLVLPFFLQHAFYQPHRDEFLYLAEGHHLAWGYMEVPPLLSVFARITDIMGGSMFWIKIWPALFGALTFLLVGKMIIHAGGRSFALLLGFFPFIWEGYIRLFFLFQPNFLEVFWWTAMAYTIFRYTQTQENKWLYYFGLCTGLGLMSKYSTAFYTLSLLGGLALTRYRKVFTNKHLYYAAGIAFIIFLPNLLWQYNHRFPVVHHMQELQQQQLQFIHPSGFLLSQLMSNLTCLFLLIGSAVCMIRKDGASYRVFGWAYCILIALLLLLQGKDYYAMGGYMALFATGALFMEKITTRKARWTRALMIGFPVALGSFTMPLLMPLFPPQKLVAYYQRTRLNKTGSFRWEDLEAHPLPQDFADMIGWKEIAEKTAAIYNSLPPAEKAGTVIYCRGYYTAGALNYYGPRLGLPEVYSDNASFLWWMPEKYQVRNLLLIGHQIPGKDDIVFQQFEKMTVRDSLVYPLARENGMRMILFEQANDQVNGMIEKILREKKAVFLR